MISPEYCQTLAQYNTWMNDKIYKACETLSEEEFKADKGLFFKSLHLSLNHIMYGDLALISRVNADWNTSPTLGSVLYPNFADLYQARKQLDLDILTWADHLTVDFLAQDLTYTSKVDSISRTIPHWLYLTHLFNHQTHHRGQISTTLHQMGFDLGATDLPVMYGQLSTQS